MVGESQQSANAIIAKALESAGVSGQNIELPPEAVSEQANTLPSSDGLPKGQVKGESPEEKAEREEAESSEAGAIKPSEPKPGEPIAQPLGKAEIEAAVTEATSRFQSMVDKKINQIQFQMQQTVGALNQFFQTQEDSNISGLSTEEQVQRRLDRLEKPTQPRIQIQSQPQQPDAAVRQLYQYLVDMADVAGLKPDDKRLDWAGDLPVGQVSEIVNRFKTSVKNSLVADQTKVIQELKESGGKEIQKLRKKTGVDKVSTTGPSGAGLPDVDKMTPMQKLEYGFKLNEELAQVNQ